MCPIPRIAPKRVQEETPKKEGTLAQLSPGKYPATIKAAEVIEGVYKSGTRTGKKYTALQVALSLETPLGELPLSQRLWPGSKPEKTLFASLGYGAEDSYEPDDLLGKKIIVYVDRNSRGYLDMVEAHRSPATEKRGG